MKGLEVFFFLLLIIACGCGTDPNNNCSSSNPIEDIEWLNTLSNECQSDETCTTVIYKGRFEGMTVFYTDLSGPLCDNVFNLTLRDCHGEVVKEYSIGDNQLFDEEVTEKEELISCPK